MKLIHIAQTHKCPLGTQLSKELFERVVQSQFAVAQAIKQNRPYPVIAEGLSRDITFSMCSRLVPREIERIKSIFPQGLPENINKLNDQQKEVLYQDGASELRLLLNEIPIIHKSISSTAFYGLNQRLIAESRRIRGKNTI